jgi:tetratricopeptide (TPR) repeat protein
MYLRHAASSVLLVIASVAIAQTPAAKPLYLVMSSGPGGIEIPTSSDWQPEEASIYDNGTRPALLMRNETSGITASFILFPNQSGKPTAAGCRADAITPVIDGMSNLITERHDADVANSKGKQLATTSYLLKLGNTGVKQHNLYGFFGDAATCAEVHLSLVGSKPNGEAHLQAALAAFNPDLAFQAEAIDYFRIGTLLFNRTPSAAIPYYKASLTHMPPGSERTTMHRVTTDQLVMALGMSGDLAASRALANKAIAADPDYPLNYYNLACADAEQGDAANARIHLQQAFERKANVIPGEAMPDPTQDNSILKLKSDASFWQFVMTLSPPTGKS